MHARKYANAARTLRRDVRQLGLHRRRHRRARSAFPRERIVVAHPGIGAEFTADGEAADLGLPYLLTVATLEPRKNLGTLVDAFALLADDELALAVVGGAGWGPQPQLDRPGVVRLGRVSDDELARLYRGAAAVVYPSRFEGFGMPITEAMASRRAGRRVGAPVAGRGLRRRGRARRPREPGGVRGRDPRRARAPRRAAREGARARRAASRGRGRASVFLEGYAPILVAHRHDAARSRRAPARRATSAGCSTTST